jgi:hypothetical protein
LVAVHVNRGHGWERARALAPQPTPPRPARSSTRFTSTCRLGRGRTGVRSASATWWNRAAQNRAARLSYQQG